MIVFAMPAALSRSLRTAAACAPAFPASAKIVTRVIPGGHCHCRIPSAEEHALLCSTLARLASRIGIERRVRDVTTLADYLQQHQGTAE
jgi:hypothetical protein